MIIYNFEFLFITSIFFLIVISIYKWCVGDSGTWFSFRENMSIIIPSNKNNFHQRKKIVESHGEKKCRDFLESYYNVPFTKVRPKFLNGLELDCYNENLRLAVEYNGIQHYKHTPFFHKTFQDFQSQIHRDRMKKKICDQHNITLISVPHTTRDIPRYIQEKLPIHLKK